MREQEKLCEKEIELALLINYTLNRQGSDAGCLFVPPAILNKRPSSVGSYPGATLAGTQAESQMEDVCFMGLSRKYKDVEIGDVHTRLTVIARCPDLSKNRQYRWLCQCVCGNTKIVRDDSLKTGAIRSCGCLSREVSRQVGLDSKTHGESNPKSVEYTAWLGIINRCCNANAVAYRDYGGRGIGVYDPWRASYPLFLAHVGRRPSPLHSIDRYPNNDGNYEPGNVRWATRKEQNRNVRTNLLITIDNTTRCLSEWSELSGISAGTLWSRLRVHCWAPQDLLLPRYSKPSQPRAERAREALRER